MGIADVVFIVSLLPCFRQAANIANPLVLELRLKADSLPLSCVARLERGSTADKLTHWRGEIVTPEPKPRTGREHEVGTITGPLLMLDLNREIEQLRSEGRWQSGHTAKTLAKYSDFRVVLIVMKAGGRLEKHRTEGQISVHTLDGRIRFTTAERSVELAIGQMLTLEHDIPHDVEGIADSAFLLTIVWKDAASVR